MTPRSFVRFHAALSAALIAAAFGSLTYLITGNSPAWWVVALSGEIAYLIATVLPKGNRALELAIEAAYDEAFGEDGPAGGVR